MAKERILVLVPPELSERIKTLSRRTGISVAEIAGECIAKSFDVYEKEVFDRPEVQEHVKKVILDARDLMALQQVAPPTSHEDFEKRVKPELRQAAKKK